MGKPDLDKVSHSFTHFASKYDLAKQDLTKKEQAPVSFLVDINGKPINSKDFNAESNNTFLHKQATLPENATTETIKEKPKSAAFQKLLERAQEINKKRERLTAATENIAEVKKVEVTTPITIEPLSIRNTIEEVKEVVPVTSLKEEKVQLLKLAELIPHTPTKKQETVKIEPIKLATLKIPETKHEPLQKINNSNQATTISIDIPSSKNEPSIHAAVKNTLIKANESLINSLNPDLILRQLNIPKLKNTFKKFIAEQKEGFTKMVTPYQVQENPVALKEFIEHTKKLIEVDKQMKPIAYRGAEQVTDKHILKIINNKDTGSIDLRKILKDYKVFKDIQDIPMNEIEKINEKEGIFACNAFGVAIVTTNLDNKKLNLKTVKDVWDKGNFEETFKVIGPGGEILPTSTGKKNNLTITEALMVQAKNTRDLWVAAGGGR